MSKAARQVAPSPAFDVVAPPGITIRRARPTDTDAIVELGIEALSTNPYPTMVIAPDRVRAVARIVISGAGNVCLVAEQAGKVVAAVSATIDPCMFYERSQASVVQFYTRVPGAGVPLLRAFLRWARSRRMVKLIVFTLEMGADPRIGTLLRRLGLTQQLPVWMEVR